MKEKTVYKIRVTGDVLETANATRRVEVYGQVLTFGREPVYVRAAGAGVGHVAVAPGEVVGEGGRVRRAEAGRIFAPQIASILPNFAHP